MVVKGLDFSIVFFTRAGLIKSHPNLIKTLHVHEENVEVDKEEELQIIRQMIFSSFKKIR